ncbi:MAG: ABC transporter ATP-binding protein [Anaerolineaceae bacterium]|nr:ABC transporter ATP-binding protein [Anaerolineaceae bacterium]
MSELIGYLKPYKKEVILGPIFKLIEAIFELLLPTILALIINNGVNQHNTAYVIKMGFVMLAMSLLGFCSSLVCQYFAARTSQGFGTTLRNAMFTHIFSLSHAEINHWGNSTLINRITNDVNQLQLAVAMLIRLVIRAPFICIGAMIMAMILDFRLALILIAATPFLGLVLYLIINKTSPLYTKYQQKMDRIAQILEENLSGVRIIRAFAQKRNEQQKFETANDDLTITAVRVGKISALLNPLTTLVMNLAILAILWLGGIHINSGTLSQGDIIAFVNYLTQILLALIVVSNLVIIFTKAYASAKRVTEVLTTSSSIIENSAESVVPVNTSAPLIEFRNVSFGYNPTGDRALSNLSIRVAQGETLGIIGGTGSGKSTFVNLIPRFYDVTDGEILIGGINIKDFPLHELRQKIGFVPQKAVLFTGTVAENIRWGNPNASIEEVAAAAKIAQAHEFIIDLPGRYDAPVTRGGTNLSGGQRQRLTIARAMVGHPQILILDDSASALDFATEAALRQAIRRSSHNLTLLMVSQRISTIQQADRILVLDDGHMAGIGTHDELMNTCRIYQEIYRSQLAGSEGVA